MLYYNYNNYGLLTLKNEEAEMHSEIYSPIKLASPPTFLIFND